MKVVATFSRRERIVTTAVVGWFSFFEVFGENKITRETIEFGFGDPSITTYTYEYNSQGYPVSITQRETGGGVFYQPLHQPLPLARFLPRPAAPAPGEAQAVMPADHFFAGVKIRYLYQIFRICMRKQSRFWAHVFLLTVAVLILLSADAYAQRVQTRKPTGRGTKATGKDVAGRKLRTRDQSSARRAVYSVPQTYSGKKVRGQTVRPVRSAVVRSSSTRTWKQSNTRARAVARPAVSRSRTRVYPARGPYVNNASRSPRVYRSPYSNKKQVARFGRPSSAPRIQSGGAAAPRSSSRAFVGRSKRNVYVGRAQRPIRGSGRDIAGRPLRTRDARSTRGQILPAPNPYVGRKAKKEGGYSGTYRSGYNSSTPQRERAWRGDVAGRPLRENRTTRKVQAGKFYFKRNLSVSGQQRQRSLPGTGFRSASRPVRAGGAPLPGRAPGIGARGLANVLSKRGIRPTKGGGGSISARRPRISAPVPVRTGAPGSERVGTYRGSIKRSELTGRGTQGLNYSGNMRASRSNRQSASSARVSSYRGSRTSGFSVIGAQGLNYSGNIRAKRKPSGGGGSISGAVRSNARLPQKQYNAPRVGLYSGSFRASRPARGGGSISNQARSNERLPQKIYNAPRVGTYAGNYRASRSAGPDRRISNYRGNLRWNQQYGIGSQGLNYQGDRKVAQLDRKKATRISQWKGGWGMFELKPSMSEQGVTTRGDIRLSRFKRNYRQSPYADERSLKKRSPSEQVFATDGLQAPVRQRDYEKKPRAAKNALAGIKPSKTSVKASEYIGNMKITWDIGRNPLSAKKALPGREPSRSLTRAASYARGVRLTHSYRHNPNSSKKALKVIYPGKDYLRIGDYQGNIRVNRVTGKKFHPDAQFAHGRVYNQDGERTTMTQLRLFWAKLFRKQAIQPNTVKEKERKPRYDKREKELWKVLYH